jgi:hypothetical protein
MAAEQKSKGIAASILPYTTILMFVIAGYVGWTFYSRRQDAKAAQQKAEAEKAAMNKKVVDQVFGSGDVKLLTFSISPIRLQRGQSAHMCYGVSNAVSVEIEPHVEDTKPSYNHCFDISPKKSTTYTLTAKDKAGHVETGSLTVTIQ